MTDPIIDASSLNPDRLLAEHREKIINLEADGLPAGDGDTPWDVLGSILAEIKRHQAASGA